MSVEGEKKWISTNKQAYFSVDTLFTIQKILQLS